MKTLAIRIFTFLAWPVLLSLPALTHLQAAAEQHFGIRVVDQATGRGIPLITLTTINHQSWVTDSAGWIAFNEPGLMNTEVFFHVQGPGYSISKDGFGYAGVRLRPEIGQTSVVPMKRENIAERLYRVTGQGIYRDTLLLGQAAPLPIDDQEKSNMVLGQDSVQVVPWRGRLFWLWGDTNVANYPLGNFRTTCAWSDLPGQGGLPPQDGVVFNYFETAEGKLRPMMPSEEAGMIWIFGLLTVKDVRGIEHLLGHYGRFESLTKRVEHGIAEYDEARGHFHSVKKLDALAWQHPEGNAVRVETSEGSYYYFTEAFPLIRVPADYESVLSTSAYESLAWSPNQKALIWQKEQPPITPSAEAVLIQNASLSADRAHFQITDVTTGKSVQIHRGSVNWNTYRQRWIMVATQASGAESNLGEVWYAESKAPEGPWRKAVKIASHPRYSFYNPRQHAFFDEDGGRFVYFEGTYAETFSGNQVPTPRYDYNQLMYRVDLADPRLSPVQDRESSPR